MYFLICVSCDINKIGCENIIIFLFYVNLCLCCFKCLFLYVVVEVNICLNCLMVVVKIDVLCFCYCWVLLKCMDKDRKECYFGYLSLCFFF